MLLALTLDGGALLVAAVAAILGPIMAGGISIAGSHILQSRKNLVSETKQAEQFESLKTDVRKNDERAVQRHDELKQTMHNEVGKIKDTLTDHDRSIIRLEQWKEGVQHCAARNTQPGEGGA